VTELVSPISVGWSKVLGDDCLQADVVTLTVDRNMAKSRFTIILPDHSIILPNFSNPTTVTH
jgi:hypothetical protein